uniref:MTM0637 n=1 Tax=Volvox carteri f. nagariensis TaxID=3068 RepID=D9CJ72_VOLCA|nr:MTM0637 [Volvox carteri f. nagariensis]
MYPAARVPRAGPVNGPTAASPITCVATAVPPRILEIDTQHSYGFSSAARDGDTSAVLMQSSHGGGARLASLSRVLLVGQPGSMFRTLANRKWPSSVGPISLLVFLFGTLLALVAAVRGVLVRKVKACKCCKGFGVVRCRLCNGRGTVDWRAKFSYSETCPLCAARRFVVCPDCGGHYHRRLFNHAKGFKGTLEAYFPLATASNPVRARSNPLD